MCSILWIMACKLLLKIQLLNAIFSTAIPCPLVLGTLKWYSTYSHQGQLSICAQCKAVITFLHTEMKQSQSYIYSSPSYERPQTVTSKNDLSKGVCLKLGSQYDALHQLNTDARSGIRLNLF